MHESSFLEATGDAPSTMRTCGRHFLQQFPHQFQCSPLVPLALHENVEHLALGIDGTRQIDQTPINLDVHLVKMPCGMKLGAAFAEIGCNRRSKMGHGQAGDRRSAVLRGGLS